MSVAPFFLSLRELMSLTYGSESLSRLRYVRACNIDLSSAFCTDQDLVSPIRLGQMLMFGALLYSMAGKPIPGDDAQPLLKVVLGAVTGFLRLVLSTTSKRRYRQWTHWLTPCSRCWA